MKSEKKKKDEKIKRRKKEKEKGERKMEKVRGREKLLCSLNRYRHGWLFISNPDGGRERESGQLLVISHSFSSLPFLSSESERKKWKVRKSSEKKKEK